MDSVLIEAREVVTEGCVGMACRIKCIMSVKLDRLGYLLHAVAYDRGEARIRVLQVEAEHALAVWVSPPLYERANGIMDVYPI